MGEITKAVGQWIVSHVGLSVLIVLSLLSCFFKIVKKEIDPLGWFIGWIGKSLTKDVRQGINDLKTETNKKFDEIKKDRSAKIEELKNDYNDKITDLRDDLDAFEAKTNTSISDMQKGTNKNCEMLKVRLDQMEKSNDMQTVRQIKAHVLDFANSCLNKHKHTKKDFENIIAENQEYEILVSKYGLVNDVYTEDYNYIMKIYRKCLEENSFLRDSDGE
jgi:hypothetical protein